MIDVTSWLETLKFDSYTEGEVNFNSSDYISFNIVPYIFYFEKDSHVLRFISYADTVCDVNNKIYQDLYLIPEPAPLPNKLILRPENGDGIEFFGKSKEKIAKIILGVLTTQLSDENKERYKIFVSNSGSFINCFDNFGKHLWQIFAAKKSSGITFTLYNLFKTYWIEIDETYPSLYRFLYSFVDEVNDMLVDEITKPLQNY